MKKHKKMDDKLYLQRRYWYLNNSIQFELLKAMRDKAVSLMQRTNANNFIHWLVIRNLESFDLTLLKRYGICGEDRNIYVSLAKYDHIPSFTFDLKKRSYSCIGWNKIAKDNIIDYDLLLDFDDKKKTKNSFQELKKEVITMWKILSIYNIKFNCYPSGNNFQIVISYENFKEWYSSDKEISKWEYVGNITEQIKKIFNLKYLCMNGIGLWNKIRKCEYSAVNNKVCIPFMNIGELKKFDYDDVELSNIEFPALVRRGLCYQNDLGDSRILSNNFRIFCLENFIVH